MKVLVVDNFDSFVYNIAQYLGELGASVVVRRNNEITMRKVRVMEPDRIVLSPGPGTPIDSRYFGNSLSIIKGAEKIPILGICLGHQGIASAFGGEIAHAGRLMHGKTSMIRHDGKGIFKGVPNPFEAARYHSLVASLFGVPSCLSVSAYSMDDCEIMGLRHAYRDINGIQFHPESILTPQGKTILKNFLDGS
jgi:anthranilate synthase/aminodeoxychorismate synthase-like glutamine amidotransferase